MKKTLILLAMVVALVILPFFVDHGGEFGGSDGEAPEALRSKHLLQAQCYAYALLRQGCVEVELRFARVEREDSAGGMQTVTYRFTAEDLDGLAVRILSARRA